MAEITTLFWDIGGVLLSNGWDHTERRRAIEHFGLDPEEFEARHHPLVPAFETRQITLPEYLDQTVFYQPRSFSVEEFRAFMFSQSQPCRDTLQLATELRHTGGYLMASINNEALELNLDRIRKFELPRYLSFFFSSCFVGARKPEKEIYVRVLEMTQRVPGECVMIDDRPENLEAPAKLGMRTVRFQTPAQLREDLAYLGVRAGAAA